MQRPDTSQTLHLKTEKGARVLVVFFKNLPLVLCADSELQSCGMGVNNLKQILEKIGKQSGPPLLMVADWNNINKVTFFKDR